MKEWEAAVAEADIVAATRLVAGQAPRGLAVSAVSVVGRGGRGGGREG